MIRLADLETMDRAVLLAAWSEVHGAPAPKGLSRSFLRRFLATDLQVRAKGGLSRRAKAALAAPEVRTARSQRGSLKPGARLLREWMGVTHRVEVIPEGYLWNGARYRSLSAIARAITGAHWSGPRFFGLADPAPSTPAPGRGPGRSSAGAPPSAPGAGAGAVATWPHSRAPRSAP